MIFPHQMILLPVDRAVRATLPFVLGLVFTTLAALQSGHNVRGLWRRSFLTSLGLGTCQFLMVQWAVRQGLEFWIFQAGAAVGAAVGSFLVARGILGRTASP